MGRSIAQAVRELCLAFPETEEVISHGSPAYKVSGKVFATFTINHHGDGRVALNVNSPAGVQQYQVEMDPACYFVPPYMGPKGWLGIELNSDVAWDSVTLRAREAWEKTAPDKVAVQLAESPSVAPPDERMSPEEIDPFLRPRSIEVLDELAQRCSSLPETNRAEQFGNPVWKAGKKTFVTTHCHNGRFHLQFWVGAERQSMLAEDPRFAVPAYMGHNGWIELDVEDYANWDEIGLLLEDSYRHFALKRMLKALDATADRSNPSSR